MQRHKPYGTALKVCVERGATLFLNRLQRRNWLELDQTGSVAQAKLSAKLGEHDILTCAVRALLNPAVVNWLDCASRTGSF